jgi:osmotically-inducible protein OsmY
VSSVWSTTSRCAYPIIHRRPDPDIALDAAEAIKRELPFSWERIKVIVEDGWITLEGDVEWHYQRERAEEAVQSVRGVQVIINNMKSGRRFQLSKSSARSSRRCSR